MIKLFILFSLLFSSICFAESVSEKNFRGQKYLFNEGWHVIPSGDKAFQHFKENSLTPASKALSMAIKDIKNSETKMKSFKYYVERSRSTNLIFSNEATSLEKKLSEYANALDDSSAHNSKEAFKQTYDRFVIGYLELKKRTKEESKRLSSFFSNYITDYKSNTKALDNGYGVIEKKFFKDMQVEWDKYFLKAEDVFDNQYIKSGSRGNALSGTWDILVGYAKVIYYGLFKPVGEESKYIVQKSIYYITKGVLNTLFFSGSVVYSTGLNLYSAGSYGYKLVSPTIESGFLASMGLITYTAGKSSKFMLKGVGVISKYAVEGVGKVTSGSQFVLETSFDGMKDAAFTIMSLSVGSSEAVLETTKGVVVLGYTALSQLSVQTLLASVNSTVFLLYDGPRIAIVKVRGADLKELPVGTVLNKSELEKNGYDIEEIKVDDEIKKNILESIE